MFAWQCSSWPPPYLAGILTHHLCLHTYSGTHTHLRPVLRTSTWEVLKCIFVVWMSDTNASIGILCLVFLPECSLICQTPNLIGLGTREETAMLCFNALDTSFHSHSTLAISITGLWALTQKPGVLQDSDCFQILGSLFCIIPFIIASPQWAGGGTL